MSPCGLIMVCLFVSVFVGGRCVEWLQRIQVSDKGNDRNYLVRDNRVFYSFITEDDGEVASTFFARLSIR